MFFVTMKDVSGFCLIGHWVFSVGILVSKRFTFENYGPNLTAEVKVYRRKNQKFKLLISR